MGLELLHDRGRGPELIGTRITIYNLIPDFLNANKTEKAICDFYKISPQQVAAARTYVLENYDAVMAKHREIEEWLNQDNPPELVEHAKVVRVRMKLYKEWMNLRSEAARERNGDSSPGSFPTFEEWESDHGVVAEPQDASR